MIDLDTKSGRDLLRQRIEADMFRRRQAKDLAATGVDVSKIERLSREILAECKAHGVDVELVSSFSRKGPLATASLSIKTSDRRSLAHRSL